VFARDGWQCQYCGARTSLTVDHVIPRSKGGGSSWDNIVASCAPCNRRKGDRLPHQINMHPRVKPRTPERAHLHPARVADDPGDVEAVPAARSGVTRRLESAGRSAPRLRGPCACPTRPRGVPRRLTTEGVASTSDALGTTALDYAGIGGLAAGGTNSGAADGGVTVWIPLQRSSSG
jgi:hypothetical protein